MITVKTITLKTGSLAHDTQAYASGTAKTELHSGWPQSRRKKFRVSRLFQSHNYTFPEVIATKRIRNNDLHISGVIPHQLLLM